MKDNNSAIYGLIWLDTDEDGIYLDTDELLSDVTVELYNEEDELIQSITSSKGVYGFENIEQGSYYIKFLSNTGYAITEKNTTPIVGSIADPETGNSDVFIVETNSTITDMNTGFYYVSCGGPKITVVNKYIKLGQEFDPLTLVEVIDCRGLDVTSNTEVTINTVDINTEGSYRIKYVIYDVTSTMSSLEGNFYVVDIEEPTITAESKNIEINTDYNPYDQVSATDDLGNDLTDDLIVIYNDVDSSVVGEYIVTYQVTDFYEQTTTLDIKITVIEEKTLLKQAVTDVITSVALEETAISNILLAESKKIESAVKIALTTEEIIEVNTSVQNLVDALKEYEEKLEEKIKIVTNQK